MDTSNFRYLYDSITLHILLFCISMQHLQPCNVLRLRIDSETFGEDVCHHST